MISLLSYMFKKTFTNFDIAIYDLFKIYIILRKS